MAKAPATIKDVLYALEYMHESLCRWPQVGAKPAAWSMEPSGLKVPARVADEALGHGALTSARHPNAVAAYRWSSAA